MLNVSYKLRVKQKWRLNKITVLEKMGLTNLVKNNVGLNIYDGHTKNNISFVLVGKTNL